MGQDRNPRCKLEELQDLRGYETTFCKNAQMGCWISNSVLEMENFVGGAVSSAGTSALLYARETPVVYPLFDYHISLSTAEET